MSGNPKISVNSNNFMRVSYRKKEIIINRTSMFGKVTISFAAGEGLS